MASERTVSGSEGPRQGERQERVALHLVSSSPGHVNEQDHACSDTTLLARVAQLEAEIQTLREENARAHQVLRSAVDYAIITMDGQGCITGWNDGARQILGYSEAEVLGRSGDLVFTAEDRNQARFTLELCRAIEAGRAANERWHVRRDGTRFWASGLMMPLLDPDNQPNGFLNILRDRTEVQTQAERRELLMAEMNHRVKNTFAMVQAVAAQSSRYASTMAEFQAAFASRLAALAQSHDMLIRGGWEDAPLREVIEGTLGTYCGEPGHVTIEGPSVLLAANMVVFFTLAFHELATNAVKHGALSVPDGTVHVSWLVKPAAKGGRQVELVWRERGGPPVRRPKRHGFGSQLLGRGLGQFGSSLRLDFQPAGVECHICFPLGATA
jgi:PAS domain S-box-containing protein